MNESSGRATVQARLPIAVGGFLLLLYLLTFPGTISPHSSDGRAMFLVTRALVDRHDIAIIPSSASEVAVTPGWHTVPIPSGPCPTEPAVIGISSKIGGPFFSKYGIGQSVAAVPLYALGLQIARAAPAANRDEVAAFVTSFFTAIVTAATATLLCALALRLGWSGSVALALSVLFGVATPAWVYTTTFFSEPTLALCLLGAVAAVLWHEDMRSPISVLLAGCSLAFAMVTHLADTALFVPVFVAFLVARVRRDQRVIVLAAFAVPILVALVLTAAYNLARFGSPFTTGYGIIGDVHDLHPPHSLKSLWEGIYGPLLSPGKGLFLYAPILLLAPWALLRFGRRDRAGAWLLACIAVVAVAAHANTLIVWLGGWAWGPRFLIPIIPILVLPLGVLMNQAGSATRRLFWLLGGLGAIIQLPAMLLDAGVYISYLSAQQPHLPGRPGCIWKAEDLYKWHPAYSPLIGQWQRLLDPSTYKTRSLYPDPYHIANGFIVPAPHPWWSLLANQGVGTLTLVGIVGGIVVLTALALITALQLARSEPPNHGRSR